jgi:3-hydroxybutyryl-CoA dehydrogenase
VWAAFGHDPRFAPSLAQRALVEAGWLGRKTGRGIYSYADPATAAAAPAPAAARPLTVIEYGHDLTDNSKTQLRELIGRSLGVAVIARDRDDAAAGLPDGLLELPSGALLIQCTGATATALSAAFERPVIVVDRVLNPAKATAIAVAPSDGCPPAALAETIALFQAGHLKVFVIDDVPGLIVTRTVAMLANLAADALASRVASEADIDTAMRLGVNYPLGPLAWAREWGTSTILGVLDSLDNWYRDGRYRASPLLRRAALSQRTPGGATLLPRQSQPGEHL